MSTMDRLSAALMMNSADKKIPEISFEIMLAMAEECNKLGHPAQAGSIRRSALTMTHMFGSGGFWAKDAWVERRKSLPWYDRIFLSRTPDEEFCRLFTETKRAEGRAVVAKIRAEVDA